MCIIQPNFRLIAEILKELEGERRPGEMDGRTDDGSNHQQQYPWVPMAAEGKNYDTYFFNTTLSNLKMEKLKQGHLVV